jgi:hypothetical protein
MSFNITAHIAHEDSLLEGADDILGAAELPDPSTDWRFYDAWKIYGTIAVSLLFQCFRVHSNTSYRLDISHVQAQLWSRTTYPTATRSRLPGVSRAGIRPVVLSGRVDLRGRRQGRSRPQGRLRRRRRRGRPERPQGRLRRRRRQGRPERPLPPGTGSVPGQGVPRGR